MTLWTLCGGELLLDKVLPAHALELIPRNSLASADLSITTSDGTPNVRISANKLPAGISRIRLSLEKIFSCVTEKAVLYYHNAFLPERRRSPLGTTDNKSPPQRHWWPLGPEPVSFWDLIHFWYGLKNSRELKSIPTAWIGSEQNMSQSMSFAAAALSLHAWCICVGSIIRLHCCSCGRDSGPRSG